MGWKIGFTRMVSMQPKPCIRRNSVNLRHLVDLSRKDNVRRRDVQAQYQASNPTSKSIRTGQTPHRMMKSTVTSQMRIVENYGQKWMKLVVGYLRCSINKVDLRNIRIRF